MVLSLFLPYFLFLFRHCIIAKTLLLQLRSLCTFLSAPSALIGFLIYIYNVAKPCKAYAQEYITLLMMHVYYANLDSAEFMIICESIKPVYCTRVDIVLALSLLIVLFQVFLRECVKQCLDDELHGKLMQKILLLQSWLRAQLQRRRYMLLRTAVVRLQVITSQCVALVSYSYSVQSTPTVYTNKAT